MVEYEIRGRCALVTIKRPEARNAVDATVTEGLEAAIDRIEADDDVWVGILAGAPPVFCAGADLKAIDAGESDRLVTARGGFAGFVRRERTKPIIAAVDGPALAGGTEIVLSCDLVVASTTATFGIPEVKRSLVAAGGGLLRLPRMLPRNIAMEMALTGDLILAERAAELGLVNRLANPGDALEMALELAEAIAANGPLALAATKRILTESVDWPDAEFFARQEEIAAPVRASDDAREGATAFAEKRAPVWKGR